ncbi:hypothetical protein HZH68_016041 [Vespula germanica]|uniref:Uncharacterized protein n=1 Tax=Vespula germanica TaxID=30212 RepID=A0A834J8W6_VESGE|nr:hypothetical protein HZH68_016041 [Vespula germanica]
MAVIQGITAASIQRLKMKEMKKAKLFFRIRSSPNHRSDGFPICFGILQSGKIGRSLGSDGKLEKWQVHIDDGFKCLASNRDTKSRSTIMESFVEKEEEKEEEEEEEEVVVVVEVEVEEEEAKEVEEAVILILRYRKASIYSSIKAGTKSLAEPQLCCIQARHHCPCDTFPVSISQQEENENFSSRLATMAPFT